MSIGDIRRFYSLTLGNEGLECNDWAENDKYPCEGIPLGIGLPHFRVAMPSTSVKTSPEPPDEKQVEEFGHPRGTLAIVFIFGALFLLGWLAMYVGIFLKRGAPH